MDCGRLAPHRTGLSKELLRCGFGVIIHPHGRDVTRAIVGCFDNVNMARSMRPCTYYARCWATLCAGSTNARTFQALAIVACVLDNAGSIWPDGQCVWAEPTLDWEIGSRGSRDAGVALRLRQRQRRLQLASPKRAITCLASTIDHQHHP
jgi:hypothetical protein